MYMFNIELAEENIQANYNKVMEYLQADPRWEQLKPLYDVLQDELLIAPASGKVYFHNAFPGGYLDHILRVTETALKVAAMYKGMEGDINFTKQELIFSAIHHDLGKLGNPEEGAYYVEQDSDWHRKRGELYKQNENLQYMKAPERGLFLLQKYGVQVTQNEWLAIKLSDGIYDEGNKSYMINYAPYAMKTNLPYIIHWADHIASRVENDKGRF
jgi:hypothetical protein